MAKSICLQVPICLFDAKNAVLCPQCEARLEDGHLTSEDIDASIWLVESEVSDRKFIENLFFPAKISSINAVWAPGGIQKTEVVVSGKRTPRFPINTDSVANIVKELRQLDIIIEFEEGNA